MRGNDSSQANSVCAVISDQDYLHGVRSDVSNPSGDGQNIQTSYVQNIHDLSTLAGLDHGFSDFTCCDKDEQSDPPNDKDHDDRTLGTSCAYHLSLFQLKMDIHITQDLSPMMRFLSQGPDEESVLFTQHHTVLSSPNKGCTCPEPKDFASEFRSGAGTPTLSKT